MLPQKAVEGMSISKQEIYEIIYQELGRTPEFSELGRIVRSARNIFPKMFNSPFPDQRVAQFLYEDILQLNKSGPNNPIVSIEALAYDVLSYELHEWLQKEAYTIREGYVQECGSRSISPRESSDDDWNTAKERALERIGRKSAVVFNS